MKPRALRVAAETDIERAFSYDLDEAGADTALRFLDEVDVALTHIESHPGTGSPRYGELCEVRGLRLWLVTRCLTRLSMWNNGTVWTSSGSRINTPTYRRD